MTQTPSDVARPVRRRPKRGALSRVLKGALYGGAALLLVFGVAVGLLYVRLSAGPLTFEGLPARVASALAARIGPGWDVAVKDSTLDLEHGSLAIKALGLEIRDPDGASVVRAPFAIVTIDNLSLLAATLQPKSIEFRDLQLRATINRDGSLSFVSAGEGGEAARPGGAEGRGAPAAQPPERQAEAGAPSRASAALSSLFDLVLEPRGIIGALDRARLGNARLTIVDWNGLERAVFSQVEATFDRAGGSARHFDMQLKGPRGEWRLGGDLRVLGPHRRDGVITATDVPVQDLLLLSGFSNLPGSTDLKLSMRAETALVRGAIERFDAHLETGAGVVQVNDKDTPLIPVDGALADASWDEGRGVLALKNLAYKGGDTNVRLQGELTGAKADQGWRLVLSGRDAVVSGATAHDKPFAIEAVEAVLAGRDEGVVVERLSLSGPTTSLDLTGSVRTLADQGGLTVNLRATGTEARTALRLWPNAVTPKVREYLLASLRAGVADALTIAVALTERDIVKATSGGPIPEETVKVDFTVRDGELLVAEGLPPLSKAAVSGSVTGTRATLQATGGRAEMADGRALNLSEGVFSVPEFWVDPTKAKVAFRLEGGADALVAVLRTPLLQSVNGLDLDPAAVKGRADLRIAAQFGFKNLPKFADLPISVSGVISDASLEKAFGKDRLEAANLTVSYDKGAFAARGDGKVVGTPVTIDVRQPRGAPGEAVASLVLDDAARARKGLSFGPQLTGPVPLKVILPLGRPLKAGPHVEADLTKAGIDDLLPGWNKAPGKPGKLSFTVVDEAGTELRDLILDSGPVQMRGVAGLASDGSLDRLDLSTFKLSQGDDMRALMERAGGTYRVTLRGNVADARPFVRSLGPSAGPAAAKTPAGAAKEARRSKDVDLDVAINILTGFNDEALTNAVVKASVRNGDLRQLQLGGRLRTATVTARMVPQQGVPVLTVQSQDAGATLRYLDVYKRMVGGELQLQAAMGEGVQTGALQIQRFTLRNEPALGRIVAQGGPGSGDNGQSGPIDFSDAEFTRAKVEFNRTSGRLEFRDAFIWGAQVGFTLNGWIDYARDRADISGTFVPAYGLNNVFAQVPLFGPLLGGGRNEGLFAVNFRVSGAASAPTLTVNPLSAIAPGFLRKLFGASPAGDRDLSAIPPYTER